MIDDTGIQTQGFFTLTQLVASFDVFETLLTRVIGEPSVAFLLLRRRLSEAGLIRCSPEVFARVRVQSERLAERNRGNNLVTLTQIYEEMAAALDLSIVASEAILTKEVELERELIRPVPGSLDRVNKARQLGNRIVFLSDMYLTSDTIKWLLEQHGFWKPGDECLVSSEVGAGKHDGRLFQWLLRKYGISAKRLRHLGNNPVSDFDQPRKLGIYSALFAEGNLNRYERILKTHHWATGGLSSAMAGASRLARLEIARQYQDKSSLIEVASSVMAPTLTAYCLWILRQSITLGLDRLYFVSRRGRDPLEITRRLATRLNQKIELRYLYGGRQAWHFPALTEIGSEQKEWILDQTDFFSVRSVLARVGIDQKRFQNHWHESVFRRHHGIGIYLRSSASNLQR